LPGLLRAQAVLAAIVLCCVLPALALLVDPAGTAALRPTDFWFAVMAGGFAVVAGQFGLPLAAALLHGEGRFRAAALVSIALSGATLLLVIPVVSSIGIAGALILAAVTALIGWVLVTADVLRRHRNVASAPLLRDVPLLAQRLRSATPSIAAAGLAGAVNWLCSISLVRQHWGHDGVGVVAIGLQWSTLMLMPVTAWGGLTLQRLGAAHAHLDPHALLHALRGQMLRNLAATASVALAVCAAAGPLAHLYGLHDTALPTVLATFAAAALVSSANNVFERLWWVAGRQRAWFTWSCLALAAQLGTTLWAMERHIAAAPAGVLVGGLVLAICSALALPAHLNAPRRHPR
jgi:O-antigen/teichoic acid export membrane protein